MEGDCAGPQPPGNVDWSGTGGQDPGQLDMLEKAHEFFQTCDVEGKGFITRRNMQRLHGELPLSLEELEKVFDTLDADGNGSLTPEEFTTGFSQFLLRQMVSSNEAPGPENENDFPSKWEENFADGGDDEDHQFSNLMAQLGARRNLADESDVKQLWLQLRKEEPHLLSSFEEFLARVFSQLQEADNEKNELESALKKFVCLLCPL